MENTKPETLWYRCKSPTYKGFIVGHYYQLEIHGEPSPVIQVAFDLRQGHKFNPNPIVGIGDSLEGFAISHNPMLDLEYIDYSKIGRANPTQNNMEKLNTSEKPEQPELIILTQRLGQQVAINAELNYSIRHKLNSIKQSNEKQEAEPVPDEPEPQSFVENLSLLISRLQEQNRFLESSYNHLNTII